MDETDSVERDPTGQEEPALTAPPAPAEFDSPDSGLPSSRNHSVASGVLSSIDDGQGGSFEDGPEEEGGGPGQSAQPGPPGPRSPPGCQDCVPDTGPACAAPYTVGDNERIALGTPCLVENTGASSDRTKRETVPD